MGMKVVKKPTKKKKHTIFYLTPNGVSSDMDMSNDDADILIKAKAIKNDPVRYQKAKQAMKMRGYR